MRGKTMSAAPAIDVLRIQYVRAQNLCDEIINLRNHLKQEPTAEPLHKLLSLIRHAHEISSALVLLKVSYAPRTPKRPANNRDCPDQLPLWHDAPANLEQ